MSVASKPPIAYSHPLKRATISAGQVAQLVEHRTENPGVAGSIPALSTRDHARKCLFFRGFRASTLRTGVNA